jgi:hypothetical protein
MWNIDRVADSADLLASAARVSKFVVAYRDRSAQVAAAALAGLATTYTSPASTAFLASCACATCWAV